MTEEERGKDVDTKMVGSLRPITGSLLGDMVRCEMRAFLDLQGDLALRAPVSGFVEMLWKQGSRHERSIIDGLPGSLIDLREVPIAERFDATLAAVASGADWIAGARLLTDDLEGRPDLLAHVDGAWSAGDVKSGGAFAANGRDPRPEYGVQVAHHASLLASLGLGRGDAAFVIAGDHANHWYDLGAPLGRGGLTLNETAEALRARARRMRDGHERARPALSAQCGLCVWRSHCRERLVAEDDLTLVAGLGRSVRATIEPHAPSVVDLAHLDLETLPTGVPEGVSGVSAARLLDFREKARVLAVAAPAFATEPLGLVRRDLELHLDLETDPTADIPFCYLHGVWRRQRTTEGDRGDFVHFLAESPGQEREAFAAAVDFLSADPAALITTFSKFERTTYRDLAARYPEVGAERVEALFSPGRCIDLYFDVVLRATRWPLPSLGLKAIAKHLGFDWNDAEASGASSISWFVEWTETRDPDLLERILRYNMNDCRASQVVFDGLIALPVMPVLPWPYEHGQVAC